VDKSGNYVHKFLWQLCGWDRVDIFLTVYSRTILKVVKSMCNEILKIKCTLMKCHTNVNSIPFTQLPHTFYVRRKNIICMSKDQDPRRRYFVVFINLTRGYMYFRFDDAIPSSDTESI
jgi:hypothetical protein